MRATAGLARATAMPGESHEGNGGARGMGRSTHITHVPIPADHVHGCCCFMASSPVGLKSCKPIDIVGCVVDWCPVVRFESQLSFKGAARCS